MVADLESQTSPHARDEFFVTISPHGTSRARHTLRLLQHRIASGEWPLNSKIPTERELVEELGVGRSTVREAVRTLANMGMLEPAPSRGTFVRSMTPVSGVLGEYMVGRELAELIEARAAIEVEASRLAAQRGSEADLAALRRAHEADLAADAGESVERGSTPGQFHALLLRAADSALLTDLHSGVMAGLRRAMDRGAARAGVDEPTRHADHARLLEALLARDPDAAAAAARRHLAHDLVPVAD